MRRWLRSLFNTLTVISFVLAILVSGLWVRSYWTVEHLAGYGSSRAFAIDLTSGWLRIEYGPPADHPPGWDHLAEAASDDDFDSRWRERLRMLCHFDYERVGDGITNGFRAVEFPPWLPLVLTLILPIATAWRWRRRRRIERCLRAERCLTCGYDLRATPDRCPECGAAAADTTKPLLLQ